MKRSWVVGCLTGGFFILGAAVQGSTPPTPAIPGVSTVQIVATPLPLNVKRPSLQTVGELRYLGGLILTSSTRTFGGLSGIRITPAGNQALVVSDRGHWFLLDLILRGNRLTDVREGQEGALLDLTGQVVKGSETDAESVEMLPENSTGSPEVLVSFERQHRIWRYSGSVNEPWAALLGRPAQQQTGWLENWSDRLPDNGGIEAMAATKDAAVLIAEDSREGRFFYKCSECGSSGQAVASFHYKGQEDFKPTEAVFLPGQKTPRKILLLSRRFSPFAGVSAVIEQVDLTEVTKGASVLQGRLIAKLASPFSVDNMEGLAIQPGPDNQFYIYLVSDDNFNPFQRTFLMKFLWVSQ